MSVAPVDLERLRREAMFLPSLSGAEVRALLAVVDAARQVVAWADWPNLARALEPFAPAVSDALLSDAGAGAAADACARAPRSPLAPAPCPSGRRVLVAREELEQAVRRAELAERERDEVRARLAEVPALVGALRRIARGGDCGAAIAADVLAGWDES